MASKRMVWANMQTRRGELLWSSLAIWVSLVAALIGFFGVWTQRGQMMRSATNAHAQAQLDYERAELARQQAQLQSMIAASVETEQSILEASRRKGSVLYKEGLSPEDRERLSHIEATEDDLSRRLAALESAILQTPEKAVAIPVMRQQIADLKDKYQSDNDAMHAEIGRLYTMMSIFFGSIVALIIGVGGLYFSVFKQRAETQSRTEPSSAPPPLQSLAAPVNNGQSNVPVSNEAP